jgi:biotin operon repressor
MGLAVAVASGGKALSTIDVEAGEVLYLALEDGPRRLQTRLNTIVKKNTPPLLDFATDWPRLDAGGIEQIGEWLDAHPQARLVIIDTLKMVRPPEGRNTSVYSSDYDCIRPLVALAKERVCVLVIHHTRKALSDDPLATVSGSFGLTGAADGILILKRDRGKAEASLHVTGRDVEEQELGMRFDPRMGMWTALGDAADLRRSKERQDIIDVLAQADEPMSPKAIADELSKNQNTIRRLIMKLADEGVIQRVKPGLYSPTADPSSSVHSVHGVHGSGNQREQVLSLEPIDLGVAVHSVHAVHANYPGRQPKKARVTI